MVFGWGKKKEEKKPEQTPVSKEISVDNIPKTVDSILQLRTSQTLAEIKSLRDQTAPLMKELIKIGQTLENDSLDVDEIDKHLRIIVVRGKKQVIDVIKKDASELPEVKNLDDAEKLNDILNQTLKKIGDVLGRQTRVIHIFAKKYAEKLKENLAQMNSNHSEIHQLLKNYDDAKITSNEILESLEKISNSKQEISHKKQRISELKENSDSHDKKIKSLNDSIEKIKSSEKFEEYQKLKKSLDELNSERIPLKNQIESQFTKISRPLGRYEYISSDKEQKNLLTQLLEDPIDILESKNKDQVIVILENVRKGILSGSISVKDVEKSMSQITETVEMLDSFVNLVDNFKQKVNDVKSKIDSFDKSELVQLEKELEKAITEKQDDEQKISSFEKDTEQLASEIPNLLAQLESKLQKFSSTKYTISKMS